MHLVHASPCSRNIGLCTKAESGLVQLGLDDHCPKDALLFVVKSVNHLISCAG